MDFQQQKPHILKKNIFTSGNDQMSSTQPELNAGFVQSPQSEQKTNRAHKLRPKFKWMQSEIDETNTQMTQLKKRQANRGGRHFKLPSMGGDHTVRQERFRNSLYLNQQAGIEENSNEQIFDAKKILLPKRQGRQAEQMSRSIQIEKSPQPTAPFSDFEPSLPNNEFDHNFVRSVRKRKRRKTYTPKVGSNIGEFLNLIKAFPLQNQNQILEQKLIEINQTTLGLKTFISDDYFSRLQQFFNLFENTFLNPNFQFESQDELVEFQDSLRHKIQEFGKDVIAIETSLNKINNDFHLTNPPTRGKKSSLLDESIYLEQNIKYQDQNKTLNISKKQQEVSYMSQKLPTQGGISKRGGNESTGSIGGNASIERFPSMDEPSSLEHSLKLFSVASIEEIAPGSQSQRQVKKIRIIQSEYRETKIQQLRSASTLSLCGKLLKLVNDNSLKQLQPNHKDYDLRTEEKDKQRKFNKQQIDRIIHDLQNEIQTNTTSEKCMIFEFEAQDNLLSNHHGIKLPVEPNNILHEILVSMMPRCIHESSKDRIFITKNLSKGFGLRIFNACFVPFKFAVKNVRIHSNKRNRLFLLCVFNHEPGELENFISGVSVKQAAKKDAGAKYVDYDLDKLSLTQPLFEQTFSHCMNYLSQMEESLDVRLEGKMIMQFFETISRSCSIRQFTEEVEKHLCILFNCSRVNVILVDRFKKNFFRYKKANHEDAKRISYPIESSIAGFVAISCQPSFTDQVRDEQRYIPDVDDPKSKIPGVEPARQIISVPVFALGDNTEKKSDSDLGNLPRAIIQLINKNDREGFTTQDIAQLDFLSVLIGRSHDQLLKVEQLHCLKSVSDKLLYCTKELDIGLAESQVYYGHVKKSINEFLDKSTHL